MLGDGTTSHVTSPEHALVVGAAFMALTLGEGTMGWKVRQEVTDNHDIQPYMTIETLGGKTFRVVIVEV